MYWFAQIFLSFHVSLHGPDLENKKFASGQHFDLTSLVDKTNKEIDCVCQRSAMDDVLDHSVNFIIANSKTVDAGEWYGLVPFTPTLFMQHTMRSNYFVPQFSPQLPWPVHFYYVYRFSQ